MDNGALKNLWLARHDLVGAALYWSGIGWVFERVRRPSGAIVLMYHSVAPKDDASYIDPPNHMTPELFERQMVYLKRNRNVVSYSSLVESILAGKDPPAGTVCISFDDGYRDNLTVAAPILQRLGLPATLFIATGYVEREQMQWADVLHCHFRFRTAHSLALPELGGGAADLSDARARRTARAELHGRLLTATIAQREDLLAHVQRQLQPDGGRPPRISLNWDDVRDLCRRFPAFELGGHTRDHIDLSIHAGDLASAEISGCTQDLARETGITPRDFAFPYERWCAATRDLIRDAGWRSAAGAGKGVRVDSDSDVFVIPRINAPSSMTALRFKTSGAYPGALNAFGINRRLGRGAA